MRYLSKFGVRIVLALSAILVGAFLALLVFYYFFIPGCNHDYIQCDINMKYIHIALLEYVEHEGKYPTKLEELHPQYVDLKKTRCTMCKADVNSTETGYSYIPGLNSDSAEGKPILFCTHYHLNGHGQGTYCAQFNILTKGGMIVHVRNYDLRKYDGPMRRYRYFKQFPYDGSRPTIEIVKSLEAKFPAGPRDCWINMDSVN